jgi:HAD superfamily phosphoserine phosphatase-like hydrolase
MKKIILFDFDRTITRTDTLKFFLISVILCRPKSGVLAIIFLIKCILTRPFSNAFKIEVFNIILSGLPEKKMKMVNIIYSMITKSFINKNIFDSLNEYIKAGKTIIIVTASPEQLIANFFKDTPVSIIGSKLAVKNNLFTGLYTGDRCFGEIKVERLKNFLKFAGKDFIIEECWSDSLDDLPMMRLARQRVWVLKNNEKDIDKIMLDNGRIITW